jgi:hypothetical protein
MIIRSDADMRSKAKCMLLISSAVLLGGALLYVTGDLSTPRDFSSPQTTIRLVDENGAPLSGIEVERSWYDADLKAEGRDMALTDNSGSCRFSTVPANVGLLTGAWRKAYSSLGMCGSGSGTQTTVYVRYHGLAKVAPKGKPLHPVGGSNQDPDGVWFDASTDSQSNTLVTLTFPMKAKSIEYALSSGLHGQ